MKKTTLIIASLIVWYANIYAQEELLEIESGIQISQNIDLTPDPGTIRWTGSDFEGWNGVIWVSLTGNAKVGTVSDIEGNTYKTIRIGNQEWMTENLRVGKYNDGTVIDQITSDAIWQNLNSGAWCWYDNDNSYDLPYGKLYNGHAVAAGNLCPTDWHVPTDGEWTILTEYLDGENVSGAKMKEVGFIHWLSPNTGATNESGWSGLPGGSRWLSFSNIGNRGYWWSSTEAGGNISARRLKYDETIIYFGSYNKEVGYSVRCLKD